jgi:signal transduction histidine kinase
MKLPQPSLTRRVTLAFVAGSFFAMLLFMLAIYPIALSEDDEPPGPELALIVLEDDVIRNAAGALALRKDSLTSELAGRHPSLWFSARLGQRTLQFGRVPSGVPEILARLPRGVHQVRFHELGYSGARGDAMLDEIETSAGEAVIIAGGIPSNQITYRDYLIYMLSYDFFLASFITAGLTLLGTLFAIPIILRSIRPVATAAESINPSDMKRRLPERRVVKELLPLVRAFNSALDRIAEGFERRRRFIADVAHELRTPLAILSLHVDALAQAAPKADLQRTVFRLGQMVGQMLDAERLSLEGRRRELVDLVELARAATADVAPLALSQGYELSFSSGRKHVMINVDPDALARALANLLGNAVAHGGGSGVIEVNVSVEGAIDVIDQGPGVAAEARERIFEPFHRERWDRDGCGLGLHLVREIMKAHGGRAYVLPGRSGGAFRLEFAPPVSAE